MVFSSHLFLFYFLPPVLLLYYVAPRRVRHLLLTVASYVFYGWANPLFIVLLLFSTALDYAAALFIAHRRRAAPSSLAPRLALVASVTANLALLGFFKYFNFAAANLDALVHWLGLPGPGAVLRVTLPLGISFYTFQSMSYTIDVYRGRVAPQRNFTDFACYVSLFSQLVAGPIIRYAELADQFAHRTHTAEKFARGVAFFALGLAKKILLANPCGKIADVTFSAGAVSPGDAWYGAAAYAFQIYFDFSGYSDMAVGLGLLFGFVFAKNFDSPYRSESITEFWQRWHISLSTWLRDYLYIPLGGNRKGTGRTYVNLAIVMLLGGLWHGAAWNFVIWGGLHGALLCYERLLGKHPLYRALPRALRVAATFLAVLVAWVFFRAPDLPSALRYLGHMLGRSPGAPNADLVSGIIYQPYYAATFAAAAAVTWLAPQTWDWARSLGWPKVAVVLGLFVLSVLVLSTQAYNPFIYFIF